MALALTALTGCGEKKRVLNVYNWGDYIDLTILPEFEQEFDCKVVYETFQTNEEMYAKLKGGGSNYDILVPSDYMIERLIKEGMLQKLDMSKIPNYKNISDDFKNLPFDPNNEYSVPYFWGTVGIAYNTNYIKEDIDSWTALWDEKYAKQFTILDSQRDALMIALKVLGYSMNTTDEGQLREAKELLLKQKPLVLGYVGDTVKDMLLSEEVYMSAVWSGEAAAVIAEKPEIKYVIPKEGTNLWFDNVVIPASATEVELAHEFINFLCRPEIALRNSEYVGYATCNKETMKLVDPSLVPSTHVYPLKEWYEEKSEVFVDIGSEIELYDRIWTEIKAE